MSNCTIRQTENNFLRWTRVYGTFSIQDMQAAGGIPEGCNPADVSPIINLTATGGLTEVTLNWINTSSSQTGVYVYRSTSSGFTPNAGNLLTTLGNVETYSDTSATAGTLYYYVVVGFNSEGESTPSNEASGQIFEEVLNILGDIESRTAWNTAGFQLDDSSGDGNNIQLATGYACEFIAANSDSTTAKNLGNFKSLTAWVKLDSTTENLIDFDGGTTYLWADAGTLTVTGATSPTEYINGAAGDTIGTDWTHIAFTTATNINATAFVIGLIGATYGDFQIKDIKLFTDELSAAQVLDDYNNPQQLKPSGTTLVAAYLTGQSQVQGDGTIFDTSGNENHLIFNTSAASVYQAAVDNVVVGRQLALSDSKNHYFLNGVNSTITLSASISQIDTTTNAWRFEFKNIYFGDNTTNYTLFNIGGGASTRLVVYYNSLSGRLYCDFFVSGVYISAYSTAISENTKYDSIVVAYSGSRTAAGITFNVDGDTSKTNTGGSGTIANTTVTFSTNAFIGHRQSSLYFRGVIPQVDIYDAVSGGNLIHSFSDDNDYNDSVGALTATLTNLGNKTVFTEDAATGNDVLGVALDLSYFDKLLNFTDPSAGANKTTAVNIGNVKTLCFLFRTSDKDTDVTIAETGTGNTIALSSGAIAATDFDTIKVDVSNNSIAANDTWYFVSMTSTTDVNLSAFAIDQNFTNGYLVNLRAYAGELSDANLTTVETEMRAYLP